MHCSAGHLMRFSLSCGTPLLHALSWALGACTSKANATFQSRCAFYLLAGFICSEGCGAPSGYYSIGPQFRGSWGCFLFFYSVFGGPLLNSVSVLFGPGRFRFLLAQLPR